MKIREDAGRPTPPIRLRVCVAISTRNRQTELTRLIPLVLAEMQAIGVDDLNRFDTRLIVVDNDPAQSAWPVVESFHAESIDYYCEPQPGVVAPRNRALAESVDDDVLVFIDDDEIPESGWLEHLLIAYITHSADAVAGPVRSTFHGEPDPFVAAGGFFDRAHRRHLKTGAPIERAATNNLLVDLHTVRRLGLTFDDRFSSTGGEDSMFTGALRAAGGRMVWCEEALVYDPVHPSRNGRRYVLNRAFTMSNSSALADLALLRRLGIAFRVTRGTSAMIRLIVGGSQAIWGRLSHNLKHRARGERAVAHSAGSLAGILGYRHSPYGRSCG